jgi:hypothetical protein
MWKENCKLRIANYKLQIAFASMLIATTGGAANATPFTFDDIEFWAGSGSNRAALAIDWDDESTEPPALVWGYRWNGSARGSDMFTAIVAADPRLFAKLGTSPSNRALYGVGYDANGNGEFDINDETVFDSLGFAYTDPADLAVATDPGDYYVEGWFTGFWHYGIAGNNPYNGGSWSDIGSGMSGRTLSDGAWDSWTFSPTFNFASFAKNPVAARSPFAPGDFNCDGNVDAADYGMWRATFGSTSEPAPDANRNGVVDVADYVIWRKSVAGAAATSGLSSTGVPEPSTIWLFLCFLCFLWLTCSFKRKEKIS